MSQLPCIFACMNDKPKLQAVTTCSSGKCLPCTPGPECTQLGKCASTFSDAGQEGLWRSVARGAILEVDDETCRKRRSNLAELKDAEPACTQSL